MPTDRVLIEIMTVANTAGIKEAQAGMLGLKGSAVGLGIAIGLVGEVSKDMMKIAEEHDAAMKGLQQAYQASGTDLSKYQGGIDAFIKTNSRYTDSQTEVINGFATLTRSGLEQAEVTRAMGIAVNLAALKHIPLAEAVDLVNKAEHGRMRGLVDLGIVTKNQVGADGDLLVGSKTIAQAITELKKKTDDGTKALTDDQQATKELGNHWHDFAVGPGGELQRAFTNAKDIANLFVTLMGEQKFWDLLDTNIISVGKHLEDWIPGLNLAMQAWKIIAGGGPSSTVPTVVHVAAPAPVGAAHTRALAGGGSLGPGESAMVGELGPELLTMGGQGGTVSPNGAGGPTVHVHIGTFVGDARQLSKILAHELRISGAFR